MQLKNLLVALVILTSYHTCYSQIDFTKDPSYWPNPFDFSLKERIDTGYTHEKVIIYLEWREKWRMENLPNLYLRYDQLEKISSLFKPFYKIEPTKNQKEKSISLDSLHKIDAKDYSWMKQKLDEDQSGSPCIFLYDFFYDIYLVKIGSNGLGAFLIKIDCRESILDDDEATEYDIEKQGDTLIIIKFPGDEKN